MAENFCEEIGRIIKSKREELGLTIKELSHRAMVPEDVLETLEAGRADTLPEPVYVRGFLKRIAKVLDIDEAKLLELFEKCEFSSSVVADIKDVIVKKKEKEKDSVWTYAVLGLIIVFVVVGIFYIKLVHNFGVKLSTSNVSIVTENETPISKGERNLEEKSAKQASILQENAFVISIRGKEDRCWYKFTTSNRTAQGFINAGDNVNFKCVSSCTLRLGNPRAVILFKDNQEITIPTIKPVTVEFTKNGVKIF